MRVKKNANILQYSLYAIAKIYKKMFLCVMSYISIFKLSS